MWSPNTLHYARKNEYVARSSTFTIVLYMNEPPPVIILAPNLVNLKNPAVMYVSSNTQ